MPKQKVNNKFVCQNCLHHLAVNSRIKIIDFLKRSGPQSVNSIVDYLQLRQPTVSYHLQHMADTGLLISNRVGKQKFYALKDHCSKRGQDCLIAKMEF